MRAFGTLARHNYRYRLATAFSNKSNYKRTHLSLHLRGQRLQGVLLCEITQVLHPRDAAPITTGTLGEAQL